MRKLYNEFFYIPEHGKVRDKVMITRVATTVIVVIMCLAAMSLTAYAYFSCNVTSDLNTIKAANFEANVLITADSDNSSVTVANNGYIKTADLAAGNYTIEITKGNSTAQKGFCVITIDGKTYYTDQIGIDTKRETDDATVKFSLHLSAPAKIEVESHWGTSVYYSYEDDDKPEFFIANQDTLDLTTATQGVEAGTLNTPDDKGGETVATQPENPPTDETTEPAETEPAEDPALSTHNNTSLN